MAHFVFRSKTAKTANSRAMNKAMKRKNRYGTTRGTVLLVMACVSLLGLSAGAADNVSTSANDSEAWRSKPPALPPPKPFKMPPITTYRLDNGLKLQLAEDHRVPYVTAYLGMKSGTISDAPDKQGVAQLTATMLTEGTRTRKSKEIAEEIDFIGGSLHAIADYDFTILNGSCLSNYTDKLFELLSDVLLNPKFPENELKLKKTNWLQELTMKRSNPDFLREERFRKVVFGPHPYGVVSPKPEMIAAVSQDDLRKFHESNYFPNDSVLLVIGDFDSEKVLALAKDALGSWAKGERKDKEIPQVALHKNRRVYLVDRPESVQSALVLGNLGIKKKDPDYFATRVMNQILGGSAHSRLFLNIREQKGYTYGAYSNLAARIHPDVFSARASVRTEVTGPAIKEFIFEMERMRDARVTKEELDDAKNYIVGQYQLGLETQSGLAQRLLEVSLFDMPEDYLETFSDKIMAVSETDVQKAAQKVIKAPDLVITVVGDAKKIKPELEPFGQIEQYDLSGELSTLSNPTKGPDS